MKTTLASSALRLARLATFLLLPSLACASNGTPHRRADEVLAREGRLPLQGAGPYVGVGTFLIQVAAKLGQPAARLPDGTWLYRNFQVGDTSTTGTLVIRFQKGRVSELSLVTPAVATAMLTPKSSAEPRLLARNP